MSTLHTISSRIFGNRIKKLRLASGLTQVQAVARQRKRLGVPIMNQSVLSRLEAGRIGPSAHSLLALCEIYQVSCEYLLTGKEALCHSDSK